MTCPLPLPLCFFRPRTYPKGYYFFSPQSSSVINQRWLLQHEHNKVSPTKNTPALQARNKGDWPLNVS